MAVFADAELGRSATRLDLFLFKVQMHNEVDEPLLYYLSASNASQ